MATSITCPNCNYEGKGKQVGTSLVDLFFFVILLFFGILPGIIYLIYQHNKAGQLVCPTCGYKYVAKNETRQVLKDKAG